MKTSELRIRGPIVSSLILAAAVVAGCTSHQEMHPVAVPLPDDLREKSLQLEFSTDNQFVCVGSPAWAAKYGDPVALRVFDMDGHPARDAVDTGGNLQGRFINLFPGAAWRSYFPSFLKDAEGWEFDWKRGFALKADGAYAELWRLSPRRQTVWNAIATRFGAAAFVERDGKMCVFIAAQGEQGDLLALEDGRLVAAVPYGHIETDSEVEARRKKLDRFGAWGKHDPAGAKFYATALAIEPSRRLVACGEFTGRRTRVVSLDAPFKTVFEAHTDQSPFSPFGGVWTVKRLQFVGSRYLVEELYFGGRLAWRSLNETTIYNLADWKPVWWDKGDIREATIAPDGSRIAYIRGRKTLIISRLQRTGQT